MDWWDVITYAVGCWFAFEIGRLIEARAWRGRAETGDLRESGGNLYRVEREFE
jgi:hypothetical protein